MSSLVAIMGVSIPIVAISAGMFHNWLKFKEKQLAIQTELTADNGYDVTPLKQIITWRDNG